MSVPYVSQLGNKATLDCGEACSAMIGRYQGHNTTIEQVEDAMNRHDMLDSLSNLKKGCDKLGIEVRQFTYVGVIDLSEWTNNGHPAICLVDYSRIPSYAKQSDYKGGHFIVVYKIDSYVWYHDPLYKADVQIRRHEFLDAFKNSALVDNKEIQIVPPIIEDDEMNEDTFLKHWVPFVRQQRREQHKLLGAFVEKVNTAGAIGMYDKNYNLIKKYKSEQEYNDDGWKSWVDVEKVKEWIL